VLGLRGCQRSGGEVQLQIFRGTRIRNLFRRIQNKGWEQYDRENARWLAYSGPFPPVPAPYEPPSAEPAPDEKELKRALGAEFEYVGQFYSNAPYLFDNCRSSAIETVEDCARRCLATSLCGNFTYAYHACCTLFRADAEFLPADRDYRQYRLR
jgi:hypothetical protein